MLRGVLPTSLADYEILRSSTVVSGLQKEDVKVTLEGDRTLQISGERTREEEKKTDTWHRVERSHGKFLRRFRLPENANVESVNAKVDKGVLTITVPKTKKTEPEVRVVNIA
jgi:HSP20 family protein